MSDHASLGLRNFILSKSIFFNRGSEFWKGVWDDDGDGAGIMKSLHMQERSYYVYIMTNPWNTVLYTGVTNNPHRRVAEHRAKEKESFTKRYNVTKMVYLEAFPTAIDAITAEKKIKGWTRAKKKSPINSVNPKWNDVLEHGDASPSASSGSA